MLRASDFQRCPKSLALKRRLQMWLYGRSNPAGEPIPDGLAPFTGLAAARWEKVLVTCEVRNQFADVVGEVNVLGEPIDDLVRLGERCATLEGEVGCKR